MKMFRVIALVLSMLFLATACSSTPKEGNKDASGHLVILVEMNGPGGETQNIPVDCSSDAKICRVFLKSKALAPTPAGTACTQQYGGPETASVSGNVDGEVVKLKFSRANGCEISRWSELMRVLRAVKPDLDSPSSMGSVVFSHA